MGITSDPTSSVRGALDDLRDLLPDQDLRENREWDIDRVAFLQGWNRLENALREVADIISQPEAGCGLASIWLWKVARVAADVERSVQRLPCGWDDVLRLGHTGLCWLVDQGRDSGARLASGGFAGSGRIGRILEPKTTPLARIRELAAEWENKFQKAPREPRGFDRVEVVDAWQPWEDKRNEFIRRTGVLIFEAVDALDVNPAFRADAAFVELVLFSLEVPENLSSKLLTEQTPAGLLALADRLQGPDNAELDTQPSRDVPVSVESQALAGTVEDGPKPTYPTPSNYARDQWIYENIQLHTCQTLSVAFRQRAKIEKWEIITSRNAFKDASRRYANFHGLPERLFR